MRVDSPYAFEWFLGFSVFAFAVAFFVTVLARRVINKGHKTFGLYLFIGLVLAILLSHLVSRWYVSSMFLEMPYGSHAWGWQESLAGIREFAFSGMMFGLLHFRND